MARRSVASKPKAPAEKKEKKGSLVPFPIWDIPAAIETEEDRDIESFSEDALRAMTKDNFNQEWALWVGDGVTTGQKAMIANLYMQDTECAVVGPMFEDACRRFDVLVKIGQERGKKL